MAYDGVTPFEPTPEMFWIPVLAVFGTGAALFTAVHLFTKRDNSWIDPMWSIFFSIPNAVIWGLKGSDNITSRMLIITIPVFIWAARLSTYIASRHTGEDYRYKEMRLGWEKSGTCGYYAQAFTFVYMMQGVFQFINNSSVLYVNLWSSNTSLPL